MKRSEIYWVDFDPSVGGEIRKTRPAVIISNDAANNALNRVMVVPMSSQITRVYPGEILVQVRGQLSKAMADQLTTASKLRFHNRIGVLSAQDMKLIEKTVLLQLGISPRGSTQ